MVNLVPQFRSKSPQPQQLAPTQLPQPQQLFAQPAFPKQLQPVPAPPLQPASENSIINDMISAVNFFISIQLLSNILLCFFVNIRKIKLNLHLLGKCLHYDKFFAHKNIFNYGENSVTVVVETVSWEKYINQQQT